METMRMTKEQVSERVGNLKDGEMLRIDFTGKGFTPHGDLTEPKRATKSEIRSMVHGLKDGEMLIIDMSGKGYPVIPDSVKSATEVAGQ